MDGHSGGRKPVRKGPVLFLKKTIPFDGEADELARL